jgi:hypothetical protein
VESESEADRWVNPGAVRSVERDGKDASGKGGKLR